MQKLFFAVLALALAAAPALAGGRLKLVNPNVPAGVSTQVRVQILDASGKPAAGPIVVKSVRVDMGPDAMKDMTAPAKAIAAKDGVVVETNFYAPGRWAVILEGTVGGQPFSGSVVVTAIMKKAEAAQPPPASSRGGGRKIVYYRNPMGLNDTSPVPKKDAMGMAYVPVYADEIARKPGTIQLSVEKMQRAGVRLATVTRQPMSRTIRAAAAVAADENRLGVLTARFSGFVDRLYVSQTGDVVRAGQPLMRVWIDDPAVIARIADYLGAKAAHADAQAAQSAAVLRQYGIAPGELSAMAAKGMPSRVVTLRAPVGGTVLDKPAVAGMRFAPGDALFKTADMARLWVLAEVGERDLPLVKAGQNAAVSFQDDPDLRFSGRVLTVYPTLDGTTRTARVRIAVANAGGRMRIGQYADVRISAPIGTQPVLRIPASAVIDDGRRAVAFVALPGGVFEPRTLALGFRSSDAVEVRSGLREGERVVVAGNFLIDAESNLQAALQTFKPGSSR